MGNKQSNRKETLPVVPQHEQRRPNDDFFNHVYKPKFFPKIQEPDPPKLVSTYRPQFAPIRVESIDTRISSTFPLSQVKSSNTNQPRLSQPAPSLDLEPVRNIKCPDSWRIWEESYHANRIKPGELKNLNSRIDKKSSDPSYKSRDEEIHNIQLKRCEEKTHLYTSMQPLNSLKHVSFNSLFSIEGRIKNLRDISEKFFPTTVKKPELTPEILEVVERCSKDYRPDELLSTIGDAEIRRKDIVTLCGLRWLNDEVVNAYMNLLVARGGQNGRKKVYTFNTFFYPKLRENGYSSIRRWTRRVDVFNYDFITVPVHLGNHWCLAFIDFTQKTISYYDSLGGRPNGCCDTLLDYLREESNDKKKQDFDDENWKLIDATYSFVIPQQSNGSDCGVFACTYAEYLTRQAKFTFGQEDMPYFRKKMIYELVEKRILE